MVGWCNEIIWHELKTYLTHSFNVSFFLARIKKTQLDQPVPNQMLKNLLQFSFTSTCSVQLLSILGLHHSNAHIFSQIPPTDGCVLHTEIRSLCTFFLPPESAVFASNFYYNKSSLFQSASTFLAFFFCIFHIRFDWRNLVIFFSPLCSEPCSSSACKRRFVLTDFARLCSVVVISSLYSPRKRCGRLFGLECIRKQVFVCNFLMH